MSDTGLMSDGYILAIDQGTTGSTVLIFDKDIGIKGRGYSEFAQHYPQPGWVEHDAAEMWSVTLRVIGEALADAGLKASEISAVGITNQRETCLLWDRKTGKPISNAIVWQDRRTAPFCDELKEQGLEDSWQSKTGLLIDPYFSGTKLHWLLDNVPGARALADAGDLAFGTVDTWMVWNLTAGRLHITDYSNASRTLLYNIHDLDWDKDILAELRVPEQVLPSVKSCSEVYGETDPDVFFGAAVPISGMAGDQQAALFGQACFERGMLKNTYGTGSFLLMNTGADPVRSKERLLTTIAWGIGSEPVQYALEGSVFITGAAIQWLRDGLGIIESASETEAMAASLKGNDDVYFVPALTGLGAPYWDPYARGMVLGLTRGTTRAHFARSALEAICYQTRDVADAMRRESGLELQTLRADGGAVANAFLMQYQSDILGVPVEVPQVPETTALGAACLAGLAIGYWGNEEELASKWKVAHRYEPTMGAEERERLYSRWQDAVGRSRGWAK